ncbi:arsenate reductase family protein [Pseudoroseicyclus tamaricis]|uniref:Arsenate reductase n=1 Tax=Pseudoroseicyclus tamaricis TaxID=2705421 RepID=A0A6B2JTV1_9RHOB|nr:ArsC/Spx/MgsR family protein [Pseudoroseicyclus tamaricis]NDV01375.1 arsenate reductase [Pseudoroseicyclus tamaricis]
MRFFGLKTCDTCRRALKDLRAAGIEPEVVDVRADGLEEGAIAAMLKALGLGVINHASTTWRGLGEEERGLPPEELLARHPTLLKRPVIEEGGSWTMGWKDDVRARYLGE